MSLFKVQELSSFNSQSSIESTTVQNFCKINGLTGVAKTVKTNKSGYPFVRFTNNANQFTDLYFSKKSSVYYAEGEVISGSMLKDLKVAAVQNADGETRLKLFREGETVSMQDIAEMF